MMVFTGCVENRNDPLKLGRCQVRIVGLHTDDKLVLPTEDLPWAYPMQPVTSAAMNGIGWTPVGPVPGTWVVIVFRDEDCQQPIMIGTVGGIPQSKAAERVIDNSDTVATDGGVVMNSLGAPLKDKDGKDLTLDQTLKNQMKGAADTVNKAINQIGNLLGIDVQGLLGKNAQQVVLPVTGADTTDKPIIVPKVEAAKETKIEAQPVPGKADEKVLNSDIVLNPPPKYAKARADEKRRNIAALIAACDRLGYTSKYAKASILGICGGESDWLLVEEGHQYSKPESLMKVFPSVFKGDMEKATRYSNWKGSKADFFREIYSPKYGPGQALGNKNPDDGALFYGRGFNQITGRPNYERIEKDLKKSGIDAPISTNPNLLINDINISCLCTVMFYKQRVKESHDSPNFFEAALKATGGFSGSKPKKKECYEYFLGQGVIPESTNKPPADEQKTYTKEEVAFLPENKQLALLEDRSSNAIVGFNDPNGKYPLRNLLNEPDTNRLARGIIKETAVAFKDQTRTKGIPSANDSGDWEQPLAPFGGQYPYTKVFESESGHVMMYDDTPGNESTSFYHRTGTFTDVDANGTQVNKIIGDGYTIIDRNGMIYIAGRCNITVGNSANILVQGAADIEVNGATNATLHNDLNLKVARDVNMAVGGDFNLHVNGAFNTNVVGAINTSTNSNMFVQASGNSSTIVEGNSSTRVNGTVALKSNSDITTDTSANIVTKSGAAIKTEATGAISAKAGGEMKIAGTVMHIKATSGNVNVDGTQFRGQQGAAATPEGVENLPVITKFVPISLEMADSALVASNSFDLLQTPVRPAPPVEIKQELNDQTNAAAEDYMKNPSKYETPESREAGIGAVRPEPKSPDDPPVVSGENMPTGDIQAFLRKQIELAQSGYWSETGMSNPANSNKNIIAMWKDIGYSYTNDQIAWCMAFVVWTLKQNGYRYCQTATASDITTKTDKFGATKVTGDVQPGDIVHWKYGKGNHVNFVYEVKPNGSFTLVGGNQTDKNVKNNNPSGGSVTISWPNGTTKSNPQIVGIYRPSKT